MLDAKTATFRWSDNGLSLQIVCEVEVGTRWKAIVTFGSTWDWILQKDARRKDKF